MKDLKTETILKIQQMDAEELKNHLLNELNNIGNECFYIDSDIDGIIVNSIIF